MKNRITVFTLVICAALILTLAGCQNAAGNNTGGADNTAAKQAVYNKFLGTWKTANELTLVYPTNNITETFTISGTEDNVTLIASSTGNNLFLNVWAVVNTNTATLTR